GSGRTGGVGGGRRLRNIVVVTEVALSFVLLIGSGLMIRSFSALQRIDPGYDPNNVLTFRLFGSGGGQPQERAAFIRDLRGRLEALPGVESVTASTPFPLAGGYSPLRWGVRTKGDPAQYAAVIRAEVAKFRSNLLIAEMQPMEALVKRAQAGTRFSLLLIGVFAVIAVILACVGLYGVLSKIVRQRTAEIGVRMALGATPGSIFNLVVGHGLRLSLVGVAAGMVAAFGLTRAMTSMLVGVILA